MLNPVTIETFISGEHVAQYQYKSFRPVKVNRQWLWQTPEINLLIEKASKALGDLNAFSKLIPDVDSYLEMLVKIEANTSSRIEGTQTTLEDAVKERKFVAPEKRDDWQEVQCYIKAMNSAVKSLKKLPLSSRLIKDAHRLLLANARGESKMPGEFRTSQNWIGGSSLQDAIYIPPAHEEVPELMSDLEKFWHNDEIVVPDLIRIAISHYQFETIHPFLDGNGRIGRLLIALYLISKGLLDKPALYISHYIEKHRAAYYGALSAVRESNNLLHWLKFFLVAVYETATAGEQTFEKILKLNSELQQKVAGLGRRKDGAEKLLALLYKKPWVDIGQITTRLKTTAKTAAGLVTEFMRLKILHETTGFKRNKEYVFRRYIDLFDRPK